MGNSYRIRTEPGSDQIINVQIDQEFDFLEILSLKIQSDDIYTRNCADYGVVVGRVTANGGFGLPNVRVSVFVPIAQEDQNNEIVSVLYPYKSPTDKNEDGYRYNLLPYEKSYSSHVPTGTFPSRSDALANPTVIQVYDKYYKYTVKTNDSGDYMIMGVPLGNQTVVMDADLSDIGEFSLTPQDLIRMGLATENQFNGNGFKASSDLNSLPQIINLQANIDVSPLWGQPEVCQIAINRVDFDLRDDANIDIQPTAVFMGSVVSATDSRVLRKNCRPATEAGNLCDLVSGPGEILCIRQTVGQDSTGKPVLEEYEFDGGAKVIDGDGTWLTDVPMNLDYIITNEFGERTISLDPSVGVPTKGKYRFKVKWEQSADLGEQVKRGYYLVPNIKEWGWNSPAVDPYQAFPSGTTQYQEVQKSYAFSLDWNDYVDPQSAIDCEDTFYEFGYNRVYTVSQFLDGYHKGTNRGRFIGIKQILENTCDSTSNKFPTNDGVKNFDLIFIIFNFFFSFITLLLIPLMVVVHLLAFLWPILKALITFVYGSLAWIVYTICRVLDAVPLVSISCNKPPSFKDIFNSLGDPFKNISLPTITYPDCELCSCSSDSLETNPNAAAFAAESLRATSLTLLGDTPNPANYSNIFEDTYAVNDPWFESLTITTQPDGTQVAERQIALQTVGFPNIDKQTDYQRLLAGVNKVFAGQRTPAAIWIGPPVAGFDLTITERMNLFNYKHQYFNRFGGYNQVKTYVASDIIANNGAFHYDNTITLLCDPDTLDNFLTGRVLSFQSPTKSLDPNTDKAESNFSGFTSSTGYSKNLKSITVNYANPDNSDQNLTQQYIVNQTPDAVQNCWVGSVTALTENNWYYYDCDGTYYSGNTPQSGTICVNDFYPNDGVAVTNVKCQEPLNLHYAKVKSDIEYFQVITAMTYSTFSNLNPPTYSGQKSLKERYIDNYNLYWKESEGKDGWFGGKYLQWSPDYSTRPFFAIPDQTELVVVILQRGVDPNTTRQTTTVDISRLCGQPYGTVQVTSKYKLNIPIQSGLVLPRHNQFTTNEDNPNNPIYFESFIFEPGENYSGYTTNMPSYYSSLDSTSIGFQIDPKGSTTILTNNKIAINSGIGGSYLKANTSLNVFATNVYMNVSNQPRYLSPLMAFGASPWYQIMGKYYELCGGKKFLGYWNDEYVEGGAYFFASIGGSVEDGRPSLRYDRFMYFSPAYSTGNTMTMVDKTNKIVMRTDRLPTSTSRTGSLNNTYLLHQNTNMSFYFVSDEGAVESYENLLSDFLINGTAEDFGNEFEDQLTSTFGCQGLVPYNCYSGNSENFGVKPTTDKCYTKVSIKGGCYVFVKTPILSLPKDFKQLSEYKARTRINFAACRNVFGHSFSNNWINGSLYHFPFRNLRFFKSPLDPVDPNGPYNEFCKDTILLHEKTNNFYYRSSPYNGNSFIGKQHSTARQRRNEKEILFPTTIMDMGPRDAFTQEISLNSDFYGYNVNNIPTTTFQDPSDLLNLFIVSRQLNSTFLQKLIGLGDGSVNAFFTRPKEKFDGDYAQMISINSELGVKQFNFESYTAQSGASTNNPFFLGADRSGEPVIGVFFSSDTQTRDLVSPRRLIRNDQVPYNAAVYDYLPIKTQEIPFYSWTTRDSNTVFGTQYNDWRTSSIKSNLYQKFNRTEVTSNYFMGENPKADFMKGYIYNRSNVLYQPGTTAEAYQFEGDKNTSDSPSYDPVNINTYFTVGLPYQFYFGLGKGKSSMNRFVKKYVNE